METRTWAKHFIESRRQRFSRLADRFRSRGNTGEKRVRRRRKILSFLSNQLFWLIPSLFFVGYLWIFIVPLPHLAHRTYIDENALQPAQVATYWDWREVHISDKFLEALERLESTNATSEQRAQYVKMEFNKMGISASTQKYSFSTKAGQVSGNNAYGILSSPGTARTEAMIISASWLSRSGRLNLRGISTILTLAGFLKQHSLWAKDIIFVVSDGHLEGMHAWLTAYHGISHSNLQADALELSSGIVWVALNIDYSGHSFSHLGIFFEGTNGRLPNQDLLNSFQRISLYTGGVPVVLNDSVDLPVTLERFLSYLPRVVGEWPYIRQYLHHAISMAYQLAYRARGRPSGVHGLFHQYRIDAFTIFAVPADGPHGFHAIGKVVESTLRTANNLLERLHASFFFYILVAPDRFVKIGGYLPCTVLICIAMMITGLRAPVDATSHGDGINSSPEEQNRRLTMPSLEVLGIVLATHLCGAVLFNLISQQWIFGHQLGAPLTIVILGSLPLPIFILRFSDSSSTRSSAALKTINLCLASTVISVLSVLNFALALWLAVLLGVPLSISSPVGSLLSRITRYICYTLLGLGWLMFPYAVQTAIWDWEILSVWFAPFVCYVYVPLVLQAGLVCLLP